MIAALYVDPKGIYSGRPDVECWGLPERDARLYDGPWSVVAHPPCERWGRYWSGGPSAKVRRKLGDDGGCFASALSAVRRFGGVLEHPEASHAWSYFGLRTPPKYGGWVATDWGDGWTCCVEQGHYGHRARKATWLYAFGMNLDELPELVWGKAENKIRLDNGSHYTGEHLGMARITAKENAATPLEFAELLISIAKNATPTTSGHASLRPRGVRDLGNRSPEGYK